MKKLLFIIVIMLPIFAFANNDVKSNQENVENYVSVKAVNDYVILDEIKVNPEDITLPFVVTVSAPFETVIGINGPVTPNNTNWNVSNGYLTITYTHETNIMDIRRGGIFYIEVATSPMPQQGDDYGYAIKLIVK